MGHSLPFPVGRDTVVVAVVAVAVAVVVDHLDGCVGQFRVVERKKEEKPLDWMDYCCYSSYDNGGIGCCVHARIAVTVAVDIAVVVVDFVDVVERKGCCCCYYC